MSAGDVEVVGLLTTVNERYDRVAMHAVRRELLLQQAEATGLPLTTIELPESCSNEEYEQRMSKAVLALKERGVNTMAFGDLFLQDIREYRERQLSRAELLAMFPLWGQPTDTLARSMIDGGLRAIVTCCDPRALDRSFVGREWNHDFLDDLPHSVDPCGENGEFHTLVFDGPMFSGPLSIEVGEIVERGGFLFRDVLPRSSRRSSNPS
jgi:uncharacterized protein (TIGR00290 family)